MRRSLPLLIAVLAAGCGPEDGPRKPVPAGYQGDVQLSRYTQYVTGEPVTEFLFAQAEFTDPIENRSLDAGKRIDLQGPHGDIELVRVQLPNRKVYQKEPGTDIDPALFENGATYGMDVSGSSLDYGTPGFEIADALTVPQALTWISPDLSSGNLTIAAAATSLALTWVPGDGEYVDISISVAPTGQTATTRSYRVDDDGSFDFPEVGLNELPAGSGVMTVERKITTALTFPEEGSGVGLGSDAIQVLVTRQ
jgi:hypothetical protein